MNNFIILYWVTFVPVKAVKVCVHEECLNVNYKRCIGNNYTESQS